MQISDEVVQKFEEDQREKDTATAIFNLLWLNAAEQLNDIGCTGVHTTMPNDAEALDA